MVDFRIVQTSKGTSLPGTTLLSRYWSRYNPQCDIWLWQRKQIKKKRKKEKN